MPLDAASHHHCLGAADRRRIAYSSSGCRCFTHCRVLTLDAASQTLGQGAAVRRCSAYPRSGCCGATPPRTPSVWVPPIDTASHNLGQGAPHNPVRGCRSTLPRRFAVLDASRLISQGGQSRCSTSHRTPSVRVAKGAAARRRLAHYRSGCCYSTPPRTSAVRVLLLDAASHALGQGAAARRRLAHPRSGCCGSTPPRTLPRSGCCRSSPPNTTSVRKLPLDDA